MKRFGMIFFLLFSFGVGLRAQNFPTPQQVKNFILKSDSLYSDSLHKQIKRLIIEDLRDDGIAHGRLILGDPVWYKQHRWAIDRAKFRIEKSLKDKDWMVSCEINDIDLCHIVGCESLVTQFGWTIRAKANAKGRR